MILSRYTHPYYDAGRFISALLYHRLPYDFFYTQFIQDKQKVHLGGYKIYSQSKDGYDFLIHKNKSMNKSTTIYFIGNRQECIAAQINDKRKKDEIHISTFSYFEQCSEGAKLPRKNGAKIIMKVFLSFLKKKGFKKVTLTDNSFITCKKGGKVSLSEYYFFKYGYLYYMKYGFTFHHENKKTMKKMRENWSEVRNKYWKHRQITPRFLEKFKQYIDMKNESNKDELDQIYDNIQTYKRVSTFLKHYRFVSCKKFQSFLDFLKHYYQLGSFSDYYESFILYV